MAISTVRARLNGTWYSLAKNSSTGEWSVTLTAPGTTSYNLAGKYYNVDVEATNTAGTTVTASGADLSSLRLVVKETVPPTVTITAPASGAYVTTNKPKIIFKIVDQANGSGVDLSTLSFKVDGSTVSLSSVSSTAITNGFQVTYTPSAMSDGRHTISITCKDHDGNISTSKSSSFTVDTVPPTLNVTSPVVGLITNAPGLVVQGVTNDDTSSPVTVKVTLNGADQGAVTVAQDGGFSKSITMAEGMNTIVVTATDAAGQSSTITRTAELDTSVPVIQSATVSPNPANTDDSVVVTVVVS